MTTNNIEKKLDKLVARGIYLCWCMENYGAEQVSAGNYLIKEGKEVRKELGRLRRKLNKEGLVERG
jgi:hypothetical protein